MRRLWAAKALYVRLPLHHSHFILGDEPEVSQHPTVTVVFRIHWGDSENFLASSPDVASNGYKSRIY